MAKPWKEVIASPQYKALPPEQQAEAQAQYFNEVVAPRAGKGAEEARQQFYAAYPPAFSYSQPQKKPSTLDKVAYGIKETGRGLLQAGINLANIPAATADIFSSAAASAEKVFGGDGTYTPSPRITTQGIEKTLGLEENTLTPQSTEAKIFADALGYLIPVVGQEKAAIGAAEIVSKLTASKMGFFDKVGTGTAKLADQTVVGALAANSKPEDQNKLAPDIAMGVAMGGGMNAIGGAIGAGYRAVKGNIAPEKQALLDAAEKQDLQMMTSDFFPVKNAFTKSLQQGGEGALLGTGPARAKQYEVRSKLISDYLEKFGEYNPDDVVQSLQHTIGGKKASAGNTLNDIVKKMGDTPISTEHSLNALDIYLAKLKRLGSSAKKEHVDAFENLRAELSKPDVDFDLLKQHRTAFRSNVQGNDMVFPDYAKVMTNAVETAMGIDLKRSVAFSLGSKEAARYLKANSDYAHIFNKVLNERISKRLNKAKSEATPELINSVVFSRNASDIRRIWPNLNEKGKNAMRAAYISKMADSIDDNSPAKFLTQIAKLKKQAGGEVYNTVFSGRHMKEIEGLFDVIKATSRSDAANVVTQTGQALAPKLRTIGALLTFGGSLAVDALHGVVARIYESPATRNALLRLANTPKGSLAHEKALNEAVRYINALSQGVKSEELK